MTDQATGDFETRSELNLNKVGAWLYSKHPSTEVMCFAYRLPWYPEVGKPDDVALWHRAHPEHLISESNPPEDLFEAIADGMCFEAHNAFFEWCIWNNIMVPRYGWPIIPPHQWRCSAAKAAASSLPRKLEWACDVLSLSQQKDDEGHKLMLKMCKPRRPLKAEVEAFAEENGIEFDPMKRGADKKVIALMPTLWHETEEDLVRQWGYCRQDVRAEHALSEFTSDLSEHELKVWQADQRMNQRGVMVDLEMCEAALKMAEDWKRRLNEELEDLTGVQRGSMRQQVKDWLLENENLDLPDTKADTLEWLIENGNLSRRARRVCEITVDVNRTSTRKYKTMIEQADPDDGRIRDILKYCGADRTGRWSGPGIQVHNFPARDLIIKDMDEAAELIKSGDVEWVRVLYGDVMKFLSHALRGALVPSPGKKFVIADYAAIEARVVLWLAGATEALEVFLRGEDIYCDMATGIYGYEVNKKDHPNERQFGKQAILGLGFGMGYLTFLLTCRKYGIKFSHEQVLGILGPENMAKYETWVRRKLFPLSDDFEETRDFVNAKRSASIDRRRLVEARLDPKAVAHELALMKFTVDVYRSRYPEVKQMWSDLEAAAIAAVRTGEPQTCGKVTYFMEGRFLKCRLPSGRCLHYLDPKVSLKRTPWGEKRGHLSYVGPHPTTKRPVRIGTYGGKLAENNTQSSARDIMAEAIVIIDESPIYVPVMSIHDEGVSEVDDDWEDLEDYARCMVPKRDWTAGCPIEAEPEFARRFKK